MELLIPLYLDSDETCLSLLVDRQLIAITTAVSDRNTKS
jgi:hypothetical protein